MTKQDEDGDWWYEENGKWLPCTLVQMKDGSIEWLQATETEVISAMNPS